jgi:hypothetical protein
MLEILNIARRTIWSTAALFILFAGVGVIDASAQRSTACKRGTPKAKCVAAKRQQQRKEIPMTKAVASSLTALPDGNWADAGIQLTTESGRTTISFDCADAEMKGGLRIDAKGDFDLEGTFTPLKGDVVKGLAAGRAVAARFVGTVSADEMTLRITTADGKTLIGEYTLGKDLIVRLRRCD